VQALLPYPPPYPPFSTIIPPASSARQPTPSLTALNPNTPITSAPPQNLP
jgi:hypothetical protein